MLTKTINKTNGLQSYHCKLYIRHRLALQGIGVYLKEWRPYHQTIFKYRAYYITIYHSGGLDIGIISISFNESQYPWTLNRYSISMFAKLKFFVKYDPLMEDLYSSCWTLMKYFFIILYKVYRKSFSSNIPWYLSSAYLLDTSQIIDINLREERVG